MVFRFLTFLYQAIVSFVNQKLERLGLSVQSLDTQVRAFLGPRAGKRVSRP